ncbi:TlpA disulfide reductase family protein [Winogradskyella sp.]|uniref:TlpA family protein disulfide reductase n=1 Tax=Winogradskyella sp. TaxID=1883156 RepID=UPI0026211CFA|nr:TlpA disulfide reductase family protein [Winogradskyella sp.]
MRKLLTFCITISLFACKEESKIDYTLFSGKIENPTDKLVTVYHGREKVKEISLTDDGTFADTLKVKSGYYTINHGREGSAMYLNPGDDIKVFIDTKEFDETIAYTGTGSENSNFLAAKFLAEEKFDLNYAELFAMEENDFLARMDEIKSSKVEFLKASQSISNELRGLEDKHIEYEYLGNLLNYKSYHSYYAKKEEFTPSKEFMEIFETVNFGNKTDYETLDSYKRLVQGYYTNKIGDSDNPSEIFNEINDMDFPLLKEDLAGSLRYNIGPNNEHNEAYFNGIIAMSTDKKFKENITAKYNKIKKLAKGMPSPKFEEYENHKGGTTSLKDLKGKYVYMDVWATWCGPCIREIPSLKKIEEQYHGKNIAFVSTSIDKAKDHNTWVEMVKNKELGGVQLMADNDWNSQFIKDYAIEGIPRFILIDPDGNIVSADAPRPSNPKLVKMLEELKI